LLPAENDELCRPRAENLAFARQLAGEDDERRRGMMRNARPILDSSAAAGGARPC
jgi:hypothetical protein